MKNSIVVSEQFLFDVKEQLIKLDNFTHKVHKGKLPILIKDIELMIEHLVTKESRVSN